MLNFPQIDPIAIAIGPVAIRWYSLAYIGGILLGWLYARWLLKRQAVPNLHGKVFDDAIVWVTLGIILGGRLGYVLFYKPLYYLEHPGQALMLWEGGMSFHGGMLGVLVAFFLFAWRNKIPYLMLMDVAAAVTPIGLFLGRVANFINGELYGRVTDAPIGMIFPAGGALPRHPSQLYEAGLEGLGLLILLFLLARFTAARHYPGVLTGVFLLGYAASRAFVELFREPDAHLGFLFAKVTMGQLLSFPMIVLGLFLIFRALRKPRITSVQSAPA